MSLINKKALKTYILRVIKGRGNEIISNCVTRVSQSALNDYEFELQRMVEQDVDRLTANGCKTFKRPTQ